MENSFQGTLIAHNHLRFVESFFVSFSLLFLFTLIPLMFFASISGTKLKSFENTVQTSSFAPNRSKTKLLTFWLIYRGI